MPEILQIITGWGESGKVILQVNIAVFWGAVMILNEQRRENSNGMEKIPIPISRYFTISILIPT